MTETKTFAELNLSEPTMKAIKEKGYTHPTPIQAQAIPHILMSRDLVGIAQTGTGKTAGFTLPTIEILSSGRAKSRMPRSLILAPTRELASQVAESFDEYGKYHSLTKALLVGGSSMAEQIKKLDRGVDVLIATPGRLIDLFERGQILMNDIKLLIIDEADRMLDMGFIPDIEKIVENLPFARQTLLFSATMPDEIERLASKFLMNPRRVAVAAAATTSENVEQKMVWVHHKEKDDLLCTLLERSKVETAFIFCNRKREVDRLVQVLKKRKFNAGSMHGDMAQAFRNQTLDAFKKGEIKFLVCSDVAARGIDVDNVSHVFNFDTPFHPDDYVHRIGRTGRAGNKGHAWTFATKDDDKYVKAIEKNIDQKIEVEKLSDIEDKNSSKKSSSSGKSQKNNKKTTPDKRGSDTKGHVQKMPQNKALKGTSQNKSNQGGDDAIGFGDTVPAFFK
ncbi:MAG: DNA helicase [Micavibrio sp.]|nr:DNA helicase [Micavibrio sp.]|tara:strand:- start:431574 stop:432920 length:1347 start_codon:yes stop_codon:yes gene_type:complete